MYYCISHVRNNLIYNRFRHFIYIYRLIKHLKIYIIYYSKCQLNQIKRYFDYEKFNLIINLTILFYIIIINFVIVLSFNRDYNIFFTIIYKFIKRILLIAKYNI